MSLFVQWINPIKFLLQSHSAKPELKTLLF